MGVIYRKEKSKGTIYPDKLHPKEEIEQGLKDCILFLSLCVPSLKNCS
jgi:hypothetical protein